MQTALQGIVKWTDLGAQNSQKAPSSHRLARASNVTVAPDELMRRVIKINAFGVLSMLWKYKPSHWAERQNVLDCLRQYWQRTWIRNEWLWYSQNLLGLSHGGGKLFFCLHIHPREASSLCLKRTYNPKRKHELFLSPMILEGRPLPICSHLAGILSAFLKTCLILWRKKEEKGDVNFWCCCLTTQRSGSDFPPLVYLSA